ncbi:PREDICTED: uncharacterized protein LOC109184993 [Ipomoea nil]|uniref:uncharacterized protein LOC109184993 n=1 Tax=Ipomoea nil TaxID=35883 RepID=UPI0009013C3B|nr:PREDICTED: uncharacterized protein LOC109184993 [Ipomoea nil]
MFEDTVSIVPSSFLAAMNNWFTPTVFFVLLNVVIATIALTSTLANQKKQTTQQTPKVAGSPSVLQRLRSINLSSFRSQEPIFKFNPDSDTLFNLEPTHHPQILEPQMPYAFYQLPQESPSLETQTTHYIFRQENETHYVSHQETVERNETHDVKTEEIEAHEEEAEEEAKPERLDGDYNEPPETKTTPSAVEISERLAAKMRKSASMKSQPEKKEDVEARRPATMKERVAAEVDEEVDAKADDFINKFRQQLKLQRVDSTLRYKEAIRKGAGS